MNQREYLLICLAEECSEIAHAVTKSLRFGLEEIHPDGGPANWLRIIHECHDLLAIMELLEEGDHIRRVWDPQAIAAKKEKVRRFMEVSERSGHLE